MHARGLTSNLAVPSTPSLTKTMKSFQPKLQIPEFIPSTKHQDMVWSPTTGSRPRRPTDDPEATDSETSAAKGALAPTGTSASTHFTSPNKPSAVPSPPDRSPIIRSPVHERIAHSPAGELVTGTQAHIWRQPSPLMDITNRQQHTVPFPSSPRHFADSAHHHALTRLASPRRGPQQNRDPKTYSNNQQPPPSPLNGPSSQDYPPSLALFNSPPPSHQTSLAGPPTASAARRPSSQSYRLPMRPSQSQTLHDPAFINQLNPLVLPPGPDLQAPQQLPPPLPQHPQYQQNPLEQQQIQTLRPNQNEDTLQIPPPGSMDPLTYWNLLYHRENSIITRLTAANLPLTPTQAAYITMLQQARVNAAASQLPYRGQKGKGAWLRQLEEVLEKIWVLRPGQTGFSEEVVARKKDFEKAVLGEIEMVRMEGRKGRY